jgi:hypothetical protein
MEYFIHNGKEQLGPFTLSELKSKNISGNTLIWNNTLEDWVQAKELKELTDILENILIQPPPIRQAKVKTNKQKSKAGVVLQLIGGLGLILVIGLYFVNYYYNISNSSFIPTESYEQKVMTVEEMEKATPVNFLNASGNYNENFWGNKIKVHGVINNTATVATYKDAVVRVTYYTKTNTEIATADYTIYDVFPPHSEVNFELKIDNYENVSTIGWDVISALNN